MGTAAESDANAGIRDSNRRRRIDEVREQRPGECRFMAVAGAVSLTGQLSIHPFTVASVGSQSTYGNGRGVVRKGMTTQVVGRSRCW